MKINQKQQKLIDNLLYKVKEKFPEIELKDLQSSPEDPRDIWVNVFADIDEDRKTELRHFSLKLENEIFLKYGFYIFLFTEDNNIVYA